MPTQAELRKKANDLRDMLTRKLNSQGWDSIRQFTQKSGVPYSQETTRRAFTESEKPLEPATLAIICRHLGYSPEDIKSILRDYTDDEHLWPLIGRQDTKMTIYDQALMLAVEQITKDHPELLRSLADYLDLLAASTGADVKEHTEKLRRKKK